MALDFELVENEIAYQPIIKVVGVGGAGGNAINHMIKRGIFGVEFVAANTDFKVLSLNQAPVKIQLGKSLTKGLGAGGNPEVGRKACEESEREIREVLKDANMVFIAAGMGGGTGTGAAPVIARICKEMDILTVAVVTKPFTFEGKARLRSAEAGLEELSKYVDSLIVIPNDRLLTLGSPNDKLYEMFKRADDVLYYAVKGISDLILTPGYINLDFADVKAVMTESGGLALMGMGEARGDDRAEIAVNMAISSPLLEDISLAGAKGVLLNISVHPETLTLHEVQLITSTVFKEINPEAKIYHGVIFDESLEDLLRITIIGTGIDLKNEKEKEVKVTSIKEGLIKREERLRKAVGEELIEDVLDIPTFLRRSAD